MPVRPINGYGMSICCFTSFPEPTQQGFSMSRLQEGFAEPLRLFGTLSARRA